MKIKYIRKFYEIDYVEDFLLPVNYTLLKFQYTLRRDEHTPTISIIPEKPSFFPALTKIVAPRHIWGNDSEIVSRIDTCELKACTSSGSSSYSDLPFIIGEISESRMLLPNMRYSLSFEWQKME